MLNVIYEDNHLLVCIKPQNVPTQKDISTDTCMVDLVTEYLREKYDKQGNVYVGLVHRLDRPTGGILVFAKTSKAAKRLTDQIQNGEFEKEYLAVCNGVIKKQNGYLVNYLKKNARDNVVEVVPESVFGAKKAELSFNVLDRTEDTTLVKVKLITGRSHQIRVQLKNIGYPICGDLKYGTASNSKKCNMALWAYMVKFNHPTTKVPMIFKVAPNEELYPWNNYYVNKFI